MNVEYTQIRDAVIARKGLVINKPFGTQYQLDGIARYGTLCIGILKNRFFYPKSISLNALGVPSLDTRVVTTFRSVGHTSCIRALDTRIGIEEAILHYNNSVIGHNELKQIDGLVLLQRDAEVEGLITERHIPLQHA